MVDSRITKQITKCRPQRKRDIKDGYSKDGTG